MLIDKLKVCLAVSLLLPGLYGTSYAGNAIAGEDVPRDSNGIQTKVSDSNISSKVKAENNAVQRSDGTSDNNSRANQSTVQKDSNLASERVVDQNATQEKLTKTSGSDKKEQSRWMTGKMIAFYIAVGLAVATIAACLLLRNTLRTRLRMKKIMIEDPDIDDFLIAFDWTSKILYFPTMIASIVAANLMYLQEADVWFFSSINPKIIGSAWFLIFFLNFIIEEYNITIMLMLTSLLSIAFLFFWLNLVGWVSGFLGLFKHFALSISATGYLLVSIIGLLTILISWVKGLFYYVTITPNYMNLQEGPTETGEQIGREDYNTRIDTSDFFGRLLGFGKIVITFKDKKRQPIVLRVSNIRSKAQLLERVRAKLVIDHKVRNAVMPQPEPQNPT
ncbi:MAG: hypothetical protein H8D56_18055 [Planctomycetes bacterium]|nr:hypothetical protein [Planctomycetota bacterium]MBL7144202.1 hypothetical protein [Phycisphaerae bacterium]